MKATVSFATKARWSDAWPGSLERLDREAAGLERALDDLDAVALDELGVAGDVVGVRVRREQVRDVQALALDDLVQRLERRAAVDEDGRPAGLVREQVRVREPVGMHAPLDQHGETVTPRERIAAAMASPLSGCARSREPRAPGASSYGACGSVGRGTAGTGNGGALAPAAPAAPVAVSTTPAGQLRRGQRDRRAAAARERHRERPAAATGERDRRQRAARRQLDDVVHERGHDPRRLERRRCVRRRRGRHGVRRRSGRSARAPARQRERRRRRRRPAARGASAAARRGADGRAPGAP